jgi:hypothetical protein
VPAWFAPLAAASVIVLLLNVALWLQRARERSRDWPTRFRRELERWDGRLPEEFERRSASRRFE